MALFRLGNWMTGMRNRPLVRLRHGLIATACALLAFGAAGAKAQQAQEDSDEDTFEQRIIKGILGGMGVDTGRPGIDYRERSPLVIPPSLDLPPPNATQAAAGAPAWPRDPETVKKKKAAVQNRTNVRAGPEDPGSSAAMTPDELRRGTTRTSSRITDPSQSGSVDDGTAGRPSTPKELGSSSIFNWRALTGQYAPETANFEGEPSRGALTQPPTGYQTPSPNYPYGITGEKSGGGWKVPTILDRPVGQEK